MSQLVFGLIVFSALIDVSLLQSWNNVNKGFYDSDWMMFYHAAQRAQAGGNPYVIAGEFRNPPPFLLLVAALKPLGYTVSRLLWCVASCLALLASGWLMASSFTPKPSNASYIKGAILILLFAPTVLLIPTASNSTAPVVLGYALAYWFFVRGEDAAGGVALCVTALVKPQLAFLTLPLLVYKRRWKAAIAYLLAGAFSTMLSLAFFGPGLLPRFFTMLKSTASGAETVGLWLKDIPGLHAMFLQIWPGNSAAGMLAYLLSLVLIAALAWYWRGPWEPQSRHFAVGWAMLPLVDLLAATYAHSDDLVLLIIPAVVLYGYARKPTGVRALDRWTVPVLLALYLSPTLVAYFRLHFVAPAMLGALLLLWKLQPPAPVDADTYAVSRQLGVTPLPT